MRGAAEAIDFYKRAFGAVEHSRTSDPGGGLHRVFWLASTGIIAAVGGVVYIAVFRRIGGVEQSDIERLRTLRIPARGLILRLLIGTRT